MHSLLSSIHKSFSSQPSSLFSSECSIITNDIHARFYLDGNCYEPDLSAFWPVEGNIAALLSPSLHHEIARHQMGAKVTVDFPDAWRLNLVEETRERMPVPAQRSWGGMGRTGVCLG